MIGVDIDPEAIADARRNAAEAGAEIELVQSSVQDFTGAADTVIMNPPFGAQNRCADRPFLEAAVRLAPVVYSLHNANTLPFLETMITALDRRITFHKSYKFEIPHMFEFHDRKKRTIDVVLLCIQPLDMRS